MYFPPISATVWPAKRERLAAWIGACLLFLALHTAMDITEFPWDSGRYWFLGSFSTLMDFPKVLRGYFFPFLLSPLHWLSHLVPALGNWPFRLGSSMTLAYVLAVVLPDFYISVFGGRVNFLRRLLVPLLTALLLPGLVVYPLSDLPAAALMLGTMACVLRAVTSTVSWRRYLLLALAGALAYGTYNTRTIYLFPAAILLVMLGTVVFRNFSLRVRGLCIGVFLLGAMVASVPQMLINHKNHGTYSPVLAVKPYRRSLFAMQLQWGMTVQRYETSIGDWSPRPGVRYMDAAGALIFDEEHLGNPSLTVGDYFSLVGRHPLQFLGIYGRHIVNGLDLRDGGAYPVDPTSQAYIRSSCNFLVVFAGLGLLLLVVARNPPRDGVSGQRWMWGFIALLPMLVIIPGAIEPRFFLPLHLAIYAVLAFNSDFAEISRLLKARWPVMLLAFGLSASLFFAVSESTMASMSFDHFNSHLGGW